MLAVGCSSAPPSPAKEGEKPSQPSAGKESAQPAKSGQGVTTLSIGSTGLGSTYYVMAAGISNLINKQPDIQTSVEPMGGADPQVRAIGEKRIDFGAVNTLAASDGYYGRPPYNSKIPLRLIIQGDATVRNIVARADAGIKTPADLKGKRFLAKRKAVADLEQLALAILKVWGVPKEQVKLLEAAEINEAVEAMKLGTADAGVLPGSPGAATIKELAESTPVVFIDLGEKMDALLKELNPAFFPTVIPTGAFKGVDKPVTTVAAGRAAFVARADLPDELIYRITKIVFSDPQELARMHTIGRDWTVDNTVKDFPVPIHPGAVKYFKEIGKWSDAAEKRQQELLSKQ